MHPNIQEQLATKNQYELHLQKLSAIREGRKNSLRGNGFNSRARSTTSNHYPYSYNSQHAYNHVLPYSQLAHITEKKHQTFMNEFNKDKRKIEIENLKLFQKLHKEMHRKSEKSNHYHYYLKGKPDYFSNHYQYESSRIRSLYPVHDGKKSFNKAENQKKVHKENERLKLKLNSCSSSLSYSKLMSGQKDRQRLRSRILRYDQKQQLKSSKYIKPLSAGSNLNQTSRNYEKSKEQRGEKRINSARVNVGKFYNYREIKKNRVENYQPKISNLRNNIKIGPTNKKSGIVTNSSANKKNYLTNQRLRGKSFFTTQL